MAALNDFNTAILFYSFTVTFLFQSFTVTFLPE